MESPSYYSIIPADVRYDKRLSSSEKLMYGEITSLCNSTGKCWATNKYFAELYSVTTKSISTWVSKLVEYGYIKSVITAVSDGAITKRRILSLSKPTRKDLAKGMEEKVMHPMEEKVMHPMEEKVTYNSTSINSTRVNSVVSNDTTVDGSLGENNGASNKVENAQPKSTAEILTEEFFALAESCRAGERRLNKFHIKKQIIALIKANTPIEDIASSIRYIFSQENIGQGEYKVKVYKATQFDAEKVNRIMMKIDDQTASAPVKVEGGVEGSGSRI